MSSLMQCHEAGKMRYSRNPLVKLSLFFLLILVSVSFVVWMGTDWRTWAERLADLHPLIYLAALSLLPAIGFPISAFYLYAGVVYGWKLGVPLCLAGLAINMTLGFWLARTLLHDPLLILVRRRGHELPQLRTATNQFRATFLLRTVPGPPFSVQNYLLALAGVPFAIYLPVSLLGQGMIACVVIVSSGLLTRHVEPWAIISGALVVFLLAGTVGTIFFKRRERDGEFKRDFKF